MFSSPPLSSGMTRELPFVPWQSSPTSASSSGLKIRRASEAKYRRLHESLRDGYVLMDMNGSIQECNETFRAMVGYSDEELARLTYMDLTPHRWHDMEKRDH